MNIGIFPNGNFTKTETGCKAGDKCLFPHYKVEEQPSTKPKKSFNSQNGKSEDTGAVAIFKTVPQLGCVLPDSEPSRLLKGVKYLGNPRQKVLRSIRRVRFTKSTLRQAIIGENKGPSLGQIQVKILHQRSSYAVKFDDRSQEETQRQQRCARAKAWNLANNFYKLKEKEKAGFYSFSEEELCWPHQP